VPAGVGETHAVPTARFSTTDLIAAWPSVAGYRRRREERAEPNTMKHIIALLLENEPGALSRVVALFSARGYNIESLTVAPTEDASLSRMTIVTTGSDEVIEQITKHLNRLIEVVKVVDLTQQLLLIHHILHLKKYLLI